jgi:hypothetical protein
MPDAAIPGSAELKLAFGREKVARAIADGGGTALYAAHLLPHFGHFLPVVVEHGIQMFELTNGAVYQAENPTPLSLEEGARKMVREQGHRLPEELYLTRIQQYRNVLGPDAFLNVAPAGVATNLGQQGFSLEEARRLSAAGADGLHVHVCRLEELEEIVQHAHGAGLLVEGYMTQYKGDTDHFSYWGIRANEPQEAADAARAMVDIGVDTIGIMFSDDPNFYSLKGASEDLPPELDERLSAVRKAVDVPISVEGQITPGRAARMREIGISIIVLGGHFDEAIEAAFAATIDSFRPNAG